MAGCDLSQPLQIESQPSAGQSADSRGPRRGSRAGVVESVHSKERPVFEVELNDYTYLKCFRINIAIFHASIAFQGNEARV